MAGLAIFSLDTASCWPIFVFSKELDSMLTYRIPGRSPRREFERAIAERNLFIPWQQVALFTVYIFFEESLLVQFIVTMVVAYCIVFKSNCLSFIIRRFLVLLVVSGFFRVGYTVAGGTNFCTSSSSRRVIISLSNSS